MYNVVSLSVGGVRSRCPCSGVWALCHKAGSLVEFHQHATGLHVPDRKRRRPDTVGVLVDVGYAARPEPPATAVVLGAVDQSVLIVVAFRRAEHLTVRRVLWYHRIDHRVAGVTAVPGHRQRVVTDLIADRERRVFSRVPQTGSTLNLLADAHVTLRAQPDFSVRAGKVDRTGQTPKV